LGEPGFERRFAEPGIFTRDERALLHLDAVVASVRVSDNLTRILACGKTFPDEFIETELFRPPNFKGAFDGLADSDLAYRSGDIVGSHGLDEHRWQPHFVSLGGNIGDTLDEFEELRRAND
jgi:hypothetical protein